MAEVSAGCDFCDTKSTLEMIKDRILNYTTVDIPTGSLVSNIVHSRDVYDLQKWLNGYAACLKNVMEVLDDLMEEDEQ